VIGVLVSLVVAAALGWAARWAGPRIGAVDLPDRALKPHDVPVPYLGGLAVAGGIAAGLAAGGRTLGAASVGVLLGALALGLADDAIGLSPPIRLTVQVGMGLALAAGGLSATALPGPVLAWAGTVVLLVAALNGVNMVDGMDGLAGGAAVLSGVGIALVAWTDGRSGVVPLVVGAAVLGFLLHNAPPARLFLGDNGAYLIGAALTSTALAAGRTVPALAGAVSCLGLFLLDLVLAVLRRSMGRMPLLLPGDRGHFYDQLRARGLSVPECLGVSYAVHAGLAAAGVGAASLTTPGALALTGSVWILALAGLARFGFVTYRAGPSPG
jgi:UDP-GlcNAc:undecaprenyl-phosphate GlcNAc-1-phosphate transferase